MSNDIKWLPELLIFRGNWEEFLELTYDRFCTDLVHHKVNFMGFEVGVRFIPATQNKGYGFWHCISEGKIEKERIPDLERCKRIGWIRAIIENAGHASIDHWTNDHNGEVCHLLWFNEQYLVVLAERENKAQKHKYLLLKTAYVTNIENRVVRLRKERDLQKKLMPPRKGTASDTPSTHGG